MNNNNNRNRNNQLPNNGRTPYYSSRQPNGQYQYRQTPQGYPPVRHRSRKQAQKAAKIFSTTCPGADVNLLRGGQPVYYYLISAE